MANFYNRLGVSQAHTILPQIRREYGPPHFSHLGGPAGGKGAESCGARANASNGPPSTLLVF